MRRHHTDDAAPARIQTSRNNTQDNVLAREDSSNSGVSGRGSWGLTDGFHDTDSGGTSLLHQLGDLPHRRLRSDGSRLGPRVHDGRQIRQCGLLTERLDVRQHRSCLGVGRRPDAQFGLDARESRIELLRCGGASLDLVKSFMEDLGDIKQPDDIAFFVADGLAK